jgi:hypothetical protein
MLSAPAHKGYPGRHPARIERVVARSASDVREARRLRVSSQDNRISQIRKRDALDAVKFAEIRIGESRCRLEGEGVGSRTTVERDASCGDTALQ